MSRKDKFTTAVGLVLLVVLFCIAAKIKLPEPTPRSEEEDTETGRVIWKTTPAAAEQTDGVRILLVDGLPTATAAAADLTETPTPKPTATKAPTPTATPAPTKAPKPTSTPKPTKTPTPKPTKAPSATYTQGKAGTQNVERGGHAWKPYARYTAITNTKSPQYRLQQKAKTDENGLRYVRDAEGVKRYCVALGVAWAGGTADDIGRCFDVTMANGAVLHCCLGDIKKVEHSQNGAGRFGSRGELLEFQVDQNKLPAAVRACGDISRLGGSFEGEAVSITTFGTFIPGFGGAK